jgi:hypothetical protein
MVLPVWADPRSVAGRAAEPVVELWERLVGPRTAQGPVNMAAVDALPEAARRWLGHALPPEATTIGAVLLKMTGRIKVGCWLPFNAVQVLSPDGYVWAARAGRGLSISGFDRYAHGAGEMRWSLAGHVPLLRAAGSDVTRSSAGRLAIEATIWLPTSFTNAAWRTGNNPDTTIATRHIGNTDTMVELSLDCDGRPRTVTMQRWANPHRESFGYYPFGGILENEATFDGITIPTKIRVGYWPDTERWNEGEFFRAEVTEATFL